MSDRIEDFAARLRENERITALQGQTLAILREDAMQHADRETVEKLRDVQAVHGQEIAVLKSRHDTPDKPAGFWDRIINAAFGGIYRQTDGPGAWKRVALSLPFLVFVGAIAILLAMVLTGTSAAELLGFDPRGEVEALEDAANALEEIADDAPEPAPPGAFAPEASGDAPDGP